MSCCARDSSSCAGYSWSPRRSVIGNRRSGVQTRRVLARKRRLLHQSRRQMITVIDNRSGRHLLGSWRHDLPVRQSVPKWRTLQVFVEWKGYRGAGEWTRTTDLLITNKLLRGTVGVFLLIYDAYIRALRHGQMATLQACFSRCGLYTQQG